MYLYVVVELDKGKKSETLVQSEASNFPPFLCDTSGISYMHVYETPLIKIRDM